MILKNIKTQHLIRFVLIVILHVGVMNVVMIFG
nr:MAG TPA: hypothetical protein [Caudoviricetes sp.]